MYIYIYIYIYMYVYIYIYIYQRGLASLTYKFFDKKNKITCKSKGK